MRASAASRMACFSSRAQYRSTPPFPDGYTNARPERVASKLSQEPSVYVLTWHVDYWDHLGWKDPYSRKSWSDRQRLLAKFLGAGLYTPQLVVDVPDLLGQRQAAGPGAIRGVERDDVTAGLNDRGR